MTVQFIMNTPGPPSCITLPRTYSDECLFIFDHGFFGCLFNYKETRGCTIIVRPLEVFTAHICLAHVGCVNLILDHEPSSSLWKARGFAWPPVLADPGKFTQIMCQSNARHKKLLTPSVTHHKETPILTLTLLLSLNFQEDEPYFFLLVTDLGTHCNGNRIFKQETREEEDMLEELIPVCVERLGSLLFVPYTFSKTLQN